MPEAPLEDSGSGLVPAAEGWFVVNTRDAEWWTSSSFGHSADFQNEKFPFKEVGFHIAVLELGQPNGLYHSEALQEDFLVIAGECKLLVEGEERELGAWDFFHCTAGTEHIFVGSGEGPCVIVMVGARRTGGGRRAVLPGLGAGGAVSGERPRGDREREGGLCSIRMAGARSAGVLGSAALGGVAALVST